MLNFENAKYRYYRLGIILLLYGVLAIYFIYNVKLSGDGGIHTTYFRDFINHGKITGISDLIYGNYGFPRFQQYTLNYPALYHVLGTILYPFSQSKTVYIIDSALLLMVALWVYSFILKIRKSEINAIFILTLLLFSGLFVSGGNNNLIFAAFALIAIVSAIFLVSATATKDLLIITICSIAGFGSKQFYLFIYPFIFILLVIKLLQKQLTLRHLVITNVLIMVLIAPVFAFQIKTTGTISTQTVEGWPVVDDILSPRHINDIEPWQYEIDEKVDIERLRLMSERHYNTINTRIQSFASDPVGTTSRWTDPNSFSLLPTTMRTNLLASLFLILLLISVLRYFRVTKLKPVTALYILCILLPFLVIMKFTKRIEYALFFPIFATLFIGLYMPNITKHSWKLFYTSLLAILVISTFSNANNTINFLDNTYMRSKASINDTNNAYNWIKDNVPAEKLVMTQNTQIDPYYTNKKMFADYRVWFLSPDDLKYYIPKYSGFSYVFIYKPNIKDEFNNWNIVPTKSPLLEDIQYKHELTEKAYENDTFMIARIK